MYVILNITIHCISLLSFLPLPSHPTPPLHLTIHRLPRVPRQLLQLTRINRLQLRTTQPPNNTPHRTCKRIERPEQDIRLRLRSELVHVAREVITLRQCCGVEDAAGEVGDVDAGEGVGGAGVAAEY